MDEGQLLSISRKNETSLVIAISMDGFQLDPSVWGGLLGDVFKHLVSGFVMAHKLSEDDVIRAVMQGFVNEIQTPDESSPTREMSIVMPQQSDEDN